MKSACLLLALLSQLQVRVNVPPAGFLGVVKTSPEVEYAGTLVKVRGEGEASVSFIARSNASYRLRARLLAIRGTQTGVRLKGESVTPAGSGSSLMPDALAVELKEAAIDLASSSVVVASGSRISRGGNNGNPDNAIVIRVRVDLPAGASEADFRFDLAVDGRPD